MHLYLDPHSYTIPVILTVVLCYLASGLGKHDGEWSLAPLLRLLWLLPVGFVWAIYFFILYLQKP